MSQAKLSKEEIARQFLLPERKSKIATLLKQEGQAYCICRSSDSSRFMIACDACEDWYHGDCIGISERESKYIRQYYCDRCQNEDPTLKTKFKAGHGRETDDSPSPTRTKHKEQDYRKTNRHRKHGDSKKGYGSRSHYKKRIKSCGQCDNCYRHEDCGRCSNCKKYKKSGYFPSGEKCVFRQCVNVQSSKSNRRKKKELEVETEVVRIFDNRKPRQCYGPGCTKQARSDSKYCSEQCGMELAFHRIFHIVPVRIQERKLTKSYAETKNKNDLIEVRRKQLEVRDILKALDKKHAELDAVQDHVKTLTIMSDNEDEQEDEGEMVMYCITCGHEIHTSTAIKHMERCFNKYESQSSFCSIQKTRIDGNNMFCDYYHPVNQTYCKRLRVLCPEHYKDPKVSDTEVCGFPLVQNVFDPTGEYCRVAKKICSKHYCWEKLRRAEIDMERVRQWLKLDELVEQEHKLRNFLLSRTGLLPLMLHSTYDHEVLSKIASQQNQKSQETKEDDDVQVV